MCNYRKTIFECNIAHFFSQNNNKKIKKAMFSLTEKRANWCVNNSVLFLLHFLMILILLEDVSFGFLHSIDSLFNRRSQYRTIVSCTITTECKMFLRFPPKTTIIHMSNNMLLILNYLKLSGYLSCCDFVYLKKVNE